MVVINFCDIQITLGISFQHKRVRGWDHMNLIQYAAGIQCTFVWNCNIKRLLKILNYFKIKIKMHSCRNFCFCELMISFFMFPLIFGAGHSLQHLQLSKK